MKNLTFNTLPFTLAAGKYAMEKIATAKAKDRKYIEQAFISEFEDIYSITHQYMTLGDVNRVLKTLKIN